MQKMLGTDITHFCRRAQKDSLWTVGCGFLRWTSCIYAGLLGCTEVYQWPDNHWAEGSKCRLNGLIEELEHDAYLWQLSLEGIFFFNWKQARDKVSPLFLDLARTPLQRTNMSQTCVHAHTRAKSNNMHVQKREHCVLEHIYSPYEQLSGSLNIPRWCAWMQVEEPGACVCWCRVRFENCGCLVQFPG